MSSGFTPVNQVRYSNVAYVKLQKKGKKFEIACYRNKIVSWRNKIETDLNEVLQVQQVFTNVGKGMVASSNDLMESFGTTDQTMVCREILDKGEMQISEQERVALLDSIFRDVASIVVEKSINPDTNRPYTVSMIQNAMRQIHFSANTSKSSKSQALDVIRKLKSVMPIARASMFIRIICGYALVSAVKDELLKDLGLTVTQEQEQELKPSSLGGSESQSSVSANLQHGQAKHQQQISLDLTIDPDQYRKIEDGVAAITNGAGRVEVLQMRVAQQSSSVNTTSANNASILPLQSVLEDDIQNKISKIASSTLLNTINEEQHTDTNTDEIGDTNSEADAEDIDVDVDDLDKKLRLLLATRDEEDSVPVGMVKKLKQKKKKSKLNVNLSLLDNDEDDDDDNDYVTDQSKVAKPLLPIECTKLEGMATEKNKTVANKIGKTTKRVEKQETIEREQRALKLKLRNQEALNKESGKSTAEQDESTDVHDKSVKALIINTVTPLTSASSGSSSSSESSSVMAAKSCNTCGGIFCDSTAYRNHFRSDWHRYNLNQKLKNLPLLSSEEEFLKLSLKDLENNSIIR